MLKFVVKCNSQRAATRSLSSHWPFMSRRPVSQASLLRIELRYPTSYPLTLTLTRSSACQLSKETSHSTIRPFSSAEYESKFWLVSWQSLPSGSFGLSTSLTRLVKAELAKLVPVLPPSSLALGYRQSNSKVCRTKPARLVAAKQAPTGILMAKFRPASKCFGAQMRQLDGSTPLESRWKANNSASQQVASGNKRNTFHLLWHRQTYVVHAT